MTGKGHTLAGLFCTIGSYHYTMEISNNNVVASLIASVFMVAGATAPDWMEIRKSNGGTVIKHRTITHWLPLWILLLFFGIANFSQNPLFGIDLFEPVLSYMNAELHPVLSAAITGFAMGGLLHLLVDLPNPMGIPILTPFHRFSLKLWKSGKFETPLCLVILLMNLYYIGFLEFNLESLNIG